MASSRGWPRPPTREGQSHVGYLEALLAAEMEERESRAITRQLERRFGVLPDWARDRIAAADSAALEEWGLRVLDAGSLDDVLA